MVYRTSLNKILAIDVKSVYSLNIVNNSGKTVYIIQLSSILFTYMLFFSIDFVYLVRHNLQTFLIKERLNIQNRWSNS